MAARRSIVAAMQGPPATLGRVARSPRALVQMAGVCAGLFILLLGAAYSSPGARSLDASALHGFTDLQRPLVDSFTQRIAQFGDPAEVGLIGLALAAVALARGRPRIAVAVIFLLAAT